MRDILQIPGEGGDGPRDPMKSAQSSMRPLLRKRFYTKVETGERDGAHVVLLDGRAVRTPGANELEFPGKRVADLVASEFLAQGDNIDPATMPVYRLANTAIDGVATDMQAVLEDILRYAGSDLLFYRAEGPEGLVERERTLWDPVVEWAERFAGGRFILAEGIIHVAQPKTAIAALGVHLNTIDDPFTLAALHSMMTLSGSALLAIAVWRAELSAEQAWKAAHVDEDWNIAQWGEDAEAAARRKARWREMDAAAKVISA